MTVLDDWVRKLLKNSLFSLIIPGICPVTLAAIIFLASSKCVFDSFLMSGMLSISTTVFLMWSDRLIMVLHSYLKKSLVFLSFLRASTIEILN